MGAYCCGKGDDGEEKKNNMARQNHIDSYLKSSNKIKIHNDSDIDLWVKVDHSKQTSASNKSSSHLNRQESQSYSAGGGYMGVTAEAGYKRSNSFTQEAAEEKSRSYGAGDAPGFEKIASDRTKYHPRYDFTYISAYYVDDENKNKTLMDNTRDIVIDNLRNTPAEQFELTHKDQGWCTVTCKGTTNFWSMTKSKKLSVAVGSEDEQKEKKKKYESHFRIESIAGSEKVVKIRSRSNGLHLIMDENMQTIQSATWDPSDRAQRFRIKQFKN